MNKTEKSSEEGMFLQDLIDLAGKNKVNPKDLFLTLCIQGVETFESRIVKTIIDAEFQHDLGRKTGVLWLKIPNSLNCILENTLNH